MDMIELARAFIRDTRAAYGGRVTQPYVDASIGAHLALRECAGIADAATRAQVWECLRCAVENADDTRDYFTDAEWKREEWPSERDYWAYTFRATAQFHSTQRECGKRAHRWLAARGLAG